jgi:hypothetical protein
MADNQPPRFPWVEALLVALTALLAWLARRKP